MKRHPAECNSGNNENNPQVCSCQMQMSCGPSQILKTWGAETCTLWAHMSGPPTALLHHHGTCRGDARLTPRSARTGDLAGRRKHAAAPPLTITLSRQDGRKSGILVPLKLSVGFLTPRKRPTYTHAHTRWGPSIPKEKQTRVIYFYQQGGILLTAGARPRPFTAFLRSG